MSAPLAQYVGSLLVVHTNVPLNNIVMLFMVKVGVYCERV